MFFLINFFRGFVAVRVFGISAERFINIAAHNGIYIWDLERFEGYVRMKVSIKDYFLLKTVSKKSGCRFRIDKKSGMPFVLHRYRKRKILFFGVFFFVVSMYILTSFVWLVKLSGNKRLNTETVLTFCEEMGFKPGAFKPRLDPKKLENWLIDRFSDISWVNVSIKGTTVSVSLTEILEKAPILDKSSPTNLVAKKDGLIIDMVTMAGTPVVKERDVVKKGDLLVLGGSIRARASIYALSYEEMSFKIPFEYEEKEYLAETKRRYYISVFDKKFLNFDYKPYEQFDKTTSLTQLKLGEDYPLPVILHTQVYRPFKLTKKRLEMSQAVELAQRTVTGRIVREFDKDIDVLDKKITTSVDENFLYVNALITIAERIDAEVAAETIEMVPESLESSTE